MAKVSIVVEAAVQDAVSDLARVDGSLNNLSGTTQKTGVGMADFKAGLDLVTGAFGTAMSAVESFVGPVVEYGKQIRDLGTFAGITAEESSRLIQVTDDLGVEFTTLRTAARNLADNGLQPSLKTLAALSDEYLAIQDPVERSQFLIDKFGARAGPALAFALSQGSAALIQMGEDAEKTGLVVGDDFVDKARQAELAMDSWEDSVLGMKVALSETLLPAIGGLLDYMSGWLTMWGGVVTSVTDAGKALFGFNDEAKDNAAVLAAANAGAGDYFERMVLIEEITYDVARANQASASRWQGIADAYAKATIEAENNLDVSARLAAGLAGTIGDAHEEYQLTLEETSVELDEQRRLLEKYESQQGQTVTRVNEASVSQAQYRLAVLDAQEAQTKLNEYTGDSEEEYLKLVVALESANEKVMKLSEGLGESSTITLDYTTKIDEANMSIAELEAAQAEAAAQLKETTAEFLFQQVAATLTKEAQLELAYTLGLIDQESYDAAVAMQELTAKYDTNRDGTITATEATAAYLREVRELRDTITGLPENRVVTVTVRTNYESYGAEPGPGAPVVVPPTDPGQTPTSGAW